MLYMKRIVFLLLLSTGTLFLSGCALPDYSETLEKDPELVEIENYFGKLSAPNAACAGVLISADLVLTNAHCLYRDNTTSKLENPKFIKFFHKKTNKAYKATAFIFHPTYKHRPILTAQNLKDGWGLVRLKEKVPLPTNRDYLGKFSDQAQPTYIFGYLNGVRTPAYIETECSYQEENNSLNFLLGNCDRTFISGSPILQKDSMGKWKIVAMQSARNGKIRIAVRIDKILIDIEKMQAFYPST